MTGTITQLSDRKIKKIAFLGGSDWKPDSKVFKDAYETAKLLGEVGYEIVNGGGSGVMLASTLGAKESRGRVLAITYHPQEKHHNFEGIDPENKFDEEVTTMDYFDRTKVLLQNSDVHIIFKGGTGTISEFGMTWASSRIHQGQAKPIVLFGDFWHEIIETFEKYMYMRNGELLLYKILDSPQDVLEYIKGLE